MLHFTHINPTDLEEMDILHQLALLSVRTSKFYKRTRRKFPGLHGNLRVGLDKSKIKCYKCSRLGHFARECRSQTTGPIITHPSTNPRPQQQNTVHYTQYAPAAHVNTAHYAATLCLCIMFKPLFHKFSRFRPLFLRHKCNLLHLKQLLQL